MWSLVVCRQAPPPPSALTQCIPPKPYTLGGRHAPLDVSAECGQVCRQAVLVTNTCQHAAAAPILPPAHLVYDASVLGCIRTPLPHNTQTHTITQGQTLSLEQVPLSPPPNSPPSYMTAPLDVSAERGQVCGQALLITNVCQHAAVAGQAGRGSSRQQQASLGHAHSQAKRLHGSGFATGVGACTTIRVQQV